VSSLNVWGFREKRQAMVLASADRSTARVISPRGGHRAPLPEIRRFQISLRSRCTANVGVIADLDRDAARARPVVPSTFFETIGAKLASMGEHGRPILGDEANWARAAF
jgi:hypothetical protein